ncbi:MAG: hypothetical protein ABI724_04090 [Betaproteobacteria bacterium]
MNPKNPDVFRPVPVIAVSIAVLLEAAPAFAASLELPSVPRDLLLYGSIVLLVIGIALRIFTDRNDADPTPRAPDLRWWRNIET